MAQSKYAVTSLIISIVGLLVIPLVLTESFDGRPEYVVPALTVFALAIFSGMVGLLEVKYKKLEGVWYAMTGMLLPLISLAVLLITII